MSSFINFNNRANYTDAKYSAEAIKIALLKSETKSSTKAEALVKNIKEPIVLNEALALFNDKLTGMKSLTNAVVEINEGRVKQFEMDYKDMESNIKKGYGWIDPEYVEDTWENTSDSIDFELIKDEILSRLIKAGLLWTSKDGESKDKKIKSIKDIKELVAEALIEEARSINKIQKEYGEVVNDMTKTVTDWKTAEGDVKTQLLEKLRALTARKKELEAELDSAVIGKDRDVELSGAFEAVVTENYEVIYSDGVSALKKFRSESQALDFMEKEIASNKKLRDIAVYKPGMHSTTQTELVVKFWGKGSYLDNVSKKDPELAAKKLEEAVVTEAYTEDDINIRFGFYGRIKHLFDEKTAKKWHAQGVKDLQKKYKISEKEALIILNFKMGRKAADQMEHGVADSAVEGLEQWYGKKLKYRIKKEIKEVENEYNGNEAVVTEGEVDIHDEIGYLIEDLYAKLNDLAEDTTDSKWRKAIENIVKGIEGVESKIGQAASKLGIVPTHESVVTEAQKYDIEASLKDIKAFNSGTSTFEETIENIVKNLGYKATPKNIEAATEHIGASQEDEDEIPVDKDLVGELYGILESKVNEATVVMDATDPKSKILKKLLKKHNVTMEVLRKVGDAGWPEVELTGSKEDLIAVLSSKDGWYDADLAEYIEESNGTFTAKVKAVTEAIDENKPYFDFLVALRDSGATNMFGAAPYLQDAFDLSKSEAKRILVEWMKSFNESLVNEKFFRMSKNTIENELYAASQALTTYYDWLKAGNDSGRGKSLDHIMDLLKKCKGDIKKFNKKEEVEGTVYEASVVMDAMDPKAKSLKKLLKKYKVTMKVLDPSGPSGWPEVELTGSVKDLTAVLADPTGWDDADLAEYIEEAAATVYEAEETPSWGNLINNINHKLNEDLRRDLKKYISENEDELNKLADEDAFETIYNNIRSEFDIVEGTKEDRDMIETFQFVF